jgi:hypothetical protein
MKKDIQFILKSYLFWRFGTIIIAVLSVRLVPLLGENFFGGKLVNYLNNPLVWGWSNFDGEHFTSIALYGYKNLQQFYFPLYPLLIRFVSALFGQELINYVWSGIFISNIALLLALFGLYKLARLDYSEKISKLTVILILFFPTSFYFGAVYTESLFLALAVWSFYLFRKNEFLLASILAMFASGSRAVGITLLPAFLIGMFVNQKPLKRDLLSLFLIPIGLLSYIYYLIINWGGPIKLYRAYTLFGEQRADHVVLLPQVFYRYIVKIIPNLTWDYFPFVFTVLLEMATGTLFLYLIIISIRKIRWDYWIFSVLGYLIPTISGSFSSMPRYVILLFPMFFFLAQTFSKMKKSLVVGIFVVMSIILFIAQSLFLRGYFIS